MTRAIALALTFLTGLAGLVYQVTWERYLAVLLGSHGEATASVLGLFLGGLALGYALFGALSRRRLLDAAAGGAAPRLLELYGGVEIGIGAWALAFPLLFQGARALSLWLPDLGDVGGFALDVGLCALLLLPPTVLMGGTIPLLTQGLSRSPDDATRVHASVYGLNTAGAFLGALLAGFWWIAELGLPGTLYAMSGLNLAAGAIFVWLGGRAAPAAALPERAEPPPAAFPVYALAVLASGFAMMTLEVVAIRLCALSLGSSEYAFSIAVAVFVLCIACGSLLVSALPRVPGWLLIASQLLLVALLTAAYRQIPQLPLLAHELRTAFSLADVAFPLFYASAFALALACMAPALLLSGAGLPLVFDHLRRRYGELGATAGRLYSWNTLGSLLGALVGGYALLFWLDLHHVYRIAVSALALGAMSLALAQSRESRRAAPAIAALLVLAPALALLLRAPAWSQELLSAGLFRIRTPLPGARVGADAGAALRQLLGDRKIVFYDDDPGVTVSVVEYAGAEQRSASRLGAQPIAGERSAGAPGRSRPGTRETASRFGAQRGAAERSPGGPGYTRPGTRVLGLHVNGKPDSATLKDSATTVLLGVLPALFAEPAKRAFVVGLGTGVTAGELAALRSIEEVVVGEISPGVVAALPHFDAATLGASHHPKIRIARSDAYRALQRSPGGFDVIASEPSNPWVSGVEMLYAREFLEAAREKLSPGGVFCQWIHQYELDEASLLLVLRSFERVFEHVAIWYGAGPDLFLLGFQNPELAQDLPRLARRAREPDFAAALGRAEIEGLAALFAHELWPLGVLRAAQLEGEIQTLLRPRLSHAAGRAFFRNDTALLPFSGFGEPAAVGRRNALLPRFFASLPEAQRERAQALAIRESCRDRSAACVPLLAHFEPQGPEREQLLRAIGQLAPSQPEFGPPIDRASLPIAARFLAEPPAAAVPAAPPSSAAELTRETQLYRTTYHHAAPYRPESLLARWDRCVGRGRACAEGAERARRLVESGAGSD